MAEDMCRTATEMIVPPGHGAIVVSALPETGVEGVYYIVDGDTPSFYTWDGTQFVSLGGECGCRVYGINERLPLTGEEGVYYIRQYSSSDGGVIYDRGWTVQKWENGRYVDRTHGYMFDIVTGTGTGNAVWDINEVGYNFSDIESRILSHSATARIKVQLGEQELYTYPYDNGNTLVCNALFLPNNSVNGFTFNIIDGGGGVPKISEPYQVLNGVVTDLTPYLAAITTEVAFYIYENRNYGPIS